MAELSAGVECFLRVCRDYQTGFSDARLSLQGVHTSEVRVTKVARSVGRDPSAAPVTPLRLEALAPGFRPVGKTLPEV